MNKSEIIEAARVAEESVKGMSNDPMWDKERALIAAARLLEMVEVLPEGSEPMVGDVIEVTWADGVNGAYTIHAEENLNHWLNSKAELKIILRNGKPVITITKGEVC